MAGHNKWSQIKHKKAATDAARGKAFTRHARLIQIAAREGGSSDPSVNSQLAAAIDAAKADSVPKDNIERAIKKGTGAAGGEAMAERVYEGYAPGGVALMITCLTDNVNRTVSDVRHALAKHGGKMAESGSVAFQFEQRGVIFVRLDEANAEEAELAAIDAGAVDVGLLDGTLHIQTAASDLMAAKQQLTHGGLTVAKAELAYVPQVTMELDDEGTATVLKIVEALEDLDDVSDVVANLS